MSDLPPFLTEGGSAALETLVPEGSAETGQVADQASSVAEAASAEPAAAAPEQPAPQPVIVPLEAVLEERERRRAVEAENAALRAQMQPVAVPDPYEDPEAFAQHQAQSIEWSMKQQGLQMSQLIATQQHGPELVGQAMAWAAERYASDPGFRQRTYNSVHPVDIAVTEFKRHQLLNDVGDDPDAFVRKRAAELGFVAPAPAPSAAPPAPAAPQKPAAPRQSLAAAPSAGSVSAPVVRTGEDRFNAIFAR